MIVIQGFYKKGKNRIISVILIKLKKEISGAIGC